MASSSAARNNRLVAVPRESYIPLSTQAIVRRLAQMLPESQRVQFIDFYRRLAGVYRHRWYEEYKVMRYGFQLFSPYATPEEMEGFNEATIDDEEDIFLDRFHSMMEKGNYLMLSKRVSAGAGANGPTGGSC